MCAALHGLCCTSLSQLHTYSIEFWRRWHSPCCVPLSPPLLWPCWRSRCTASSCRPINAALPPRLCPLRHWRVKRTTSVYCYNFSRSCGLPVNHSRYVILPILLATEVCLTIILFVINEILYHSVFWRSFNWVRPTSFVFNVLMFLLTCDSIYHLRLLLCIFIRYRWIVSFQLCGFIALNLILSWV